MTVKWAYILVYIMIQLINRANGNLNSAPPIIKSGFRAPMIIASHRNGHIDLHEMPLAAKLAQKTGLPGILSLFLLSLLDITIK